MMIDRTVNAVIIIVNNIFNLIPFTMARIGDVPEIKTVKETLNGLKANGLVKEWEIPYEHLLTRITAAIFFFTPASASLLPEIWK